MIITDLVEMFVLREMVFNNSLAAALLDNLNEKWVEPLHIPVRSSREKKMTSYLILGGGIGNGT